MLRKERRFLRQVIDINPNFVFAKDREGRFTLVNQAVADAYGTSVENLIGKTDADFNPDAAEVEHFRRGDLMVMNSLQELWIPEEKITDSNGKVRWLQTVKRPVVGDDGQALQVLGVSTDLTERLRANEALKESEARFRLMADAAPVLIWVERRDVAVHVLQQALARLHGPQRSSRRSAPAGSRASIPTTSRSSAASTPSSATQLPYQHEYRLRRHDGEYRWILDTGVPRFTPEGAFEGYIGSVIDITDRRRTEEALKESEARYRTQVENAPEAIVVFDVDAGRFVEANDNAVAALGLLARATFSQTDPLVLSAPIQPDGRRFGRRRSARTSAAPWTARRRSSSGSTGTPAGADIPCEVRLARLPSATRRLGARQRDRHLRAQAGREAAVGALPHRRDGEHDRGHRRVLRAIHAIVGELMYAKNFYVALHDSAHRPDLLPVLRGRGRSDARADAARQRPDGARPAHRRAAAHARRGLLGDARAGRGRARRARTRSPGSACR